MDDNIRVSLSYEGIGRLMKGDGVKNEMLRRADLIQQRCGDGYIAGSHQTGQRAAATVRAYSREANQDNLDNNTLLKALY